MHVNTTKAYAHSMKYKERLFRALGASVLTGRVQGRGRGRLTVRC